MKEEKKILRLTLKKQWFDMIASGVKKEEYREIKPYWEKRLISNYDELLDEQGIVEFEDYEAIEFTNGYGKNRPQITLECKGVTIGKGNPDWGAPLEDVFIIKLGKELNRTNTEKP